jgi:TRAP-type C4-dicarboxylate transport system permease small subunit
VLTQLLKKLDDAVARVEQGILLISLGMMTLLVFSDVTQRTFTRQEGKTGKLILLFMGEVDEETKATIFSTVGPALFVLLSLAFVVFATQAARSIRHDRLNLEKPALGSSAGIGLGIWVGLFAALKLLLFIFPSGVPGAQKFALGFMLWAGFLGASLATKARRHIMLDAIKKRLDAGLAPYFAGLSGVFAMFFTLYLVRLGFNQVHEEFSDWAGTEGVGVYESLPIPYWTVTLSIPASLLITSLRFGAYGLADLWYGPTQGGEEGALADMAKQGLEAMAEADADADDVDTSTAEGEG